jgi:phosphomannomutase
MGSTGDVFKAYDIRGTVPEQLDAVMCRAIGTAVARFTKAPRLLMVRDMRPSGVELSAAFAEGVRAEGTAVTDLGMASTDFLYFASGRLDAPGAMFTASHNPAGYNGIKLCLAGARPIGRDTGLTEIETLTNAVLAGPPASPVAGKLAPLDHMDLLEEYAAHARSFVDLDALRPLKIVADTANGMGS